jgi:hypothetical protein
MVDGQRDVSGQGLAYRLAVVPGLDASMASAIFNSTLERSAYDLRPQASAAAWAASSAASMSSAVPRAISVNARPVTGEMFSK